MPWETECHQLVALCKDCHEMAEGGRLALLRVMAQAPTEMLLIVASQIEHAMGHSNWDDIGDAIFWLMQHPELIKEFVRKVRILPSPTPPVPSDTEAELITLRNDMKRDSVTINATHQP